MIYVSKDRKKDVQIMLDRRADILKEINKLQTEYSAIGNILQDYFRLAEDEHNREEEK